MRHPRFGGVAAFVVATAIITAAACSSDNSTLSGPQQANSQRTTTTGTANDTGAKTDTAGDHPTTFTLVAHVGIGNSTTDTLSYTPLAGATVALSSYHFEYSGHPGPDSEMVVTTAITSGTTDASGTVSFANLPSFPLYQVDVTPPAGSGVSGTTLRIAPSYPATTNVTAILKP